MWSRRPLGAPNASPRPRRSGSRGDAMHELVSPGFDGLDAGVTPAEFRSGYSPRHVTTQRWRDSFAAALAANGMDSLFVSARWLGALTDTYGFAVQASTLTVDGQVIGAIPYCDIEDLCGRRLVSLPFSDYVDPLVDSGAAWHALVRPLV